MDLLSSLNEQLSSQRQLREPVLERIESMFAFSHIMYWGVLSDTDELELFDSSTRPIR